MFRSGVTPWKGHPLEDLLIEFVNRLSKERPKAKVLDIGCGDGWISIGMAKSGFQVWGIDSSKTAIEKARKDARRAGVEADFKVGDALKLPYEEDSFDAMVDRGLFHHILPKNRSLYLKNILLVLKKDALIYLSVFSMRNPEGIGQRFTEEDIYELFGAHFNRLKKTEDPWPTNAPAHLLHFIFERA